MVVSAGASGFTIRRRPLARGTATPQQPRFCELSGRPPATRSATANATGSVVQQHGRGREQRRLGGHLRRRSKAWPGTPTARLNLIRVLDQQDVTRTRSSRDPTSGLVRFPRGSRARGRGCCEDGKGSCREGAAPDLVGGNPDAALYPEMLGRRRTQAGVIVHTDSQRNVGRGAARISGRSG